MTLSMETGNMSYDNCSPDKASRELWKAFRKRFNGWNSCLSKCYAAAIDAHFVSTVQPNDPLADCDARDMALFEEKERCQSKCE